MRHLRPRLLGRLGTRICPECRGKIRNEKKRVCLICGKPLNGYAPRFKYCSAECRRVAARQMQRERQRLKKHPPSHLAAPEPITTTRYNYRVYQDEKEGLYLAVFDKSELIYFRGGFRRGEIRSKIEALLTGDNPRIWPTEPGFRALFTRLVQNGAAMIMNNDRALTRLFGPTAHEEFDI